MNGVHLPDLIHIQLAHHLACILKAKDLYGVELAQIRAKRFVDGVEVECAVVEALFMAVDLAADKRRKAPTSLLRRRSSHPSGQHTILN